MPLSTNHGPNRNPTLQNALLMQFRAPSKALYEPAGHMTHSEEAVAPVQERSGEHARLMR